MPDYPQTGMWIDQQPRPVSSQSIWTGKETSGVSLEPTSFAVHQQLVIAIRQSIRQVRLHNPVTRNQRWISVHRGLGCSNLALYSLALADDCSGKADRFLHNAASCVGQHALRNGFSVYAVG